ncbi:hypothetical protein HDU82_009175 [Entophlyctis luteolus]|nr:hypothetical protein HDU82_009175 [Entophlyctis luteolus]
MQASKPVSAAEIRAHVSQMVGEITSFDNDSTFVVLSHGSATLLVDVALVGSAAMGRVVSDKSLVQFIGEMAELDDWRRPDAPASFLRARIVRVMDGLDVPTYEKAVRQTRVFLQDREHLSF